MTIAEGKRVAMFVSVIGGKTYTLLWNLQAPAKLGDLPMSELKGALKKHFKLKRVVIAEILFLPMEPGGRRENC